MSFLSKALGFDGRRERNRAVAKASLPLFQQAHENREDALVRYMKAVASRDAQVEINRLNLLVRDLIQTTQDLTERVYALETGEPRKPIL